MTMTRLQLVDLHSGMECESLEGLGVKGCHLHLYRKPDPKRGCRPSALTEVSTGNPQHLAGMESTAGHLMKAGLALGKEASQVHSKNIQLEYNAFNQELQYLKHTEKERGERDVSYNVIFCHYSKLKTDLCKNIFVFLLHGFGNIFYAVTYPGPGNRGRMSPLTVRENTRTSPLTVVDPDFDQCMQINR